jgi:hypothetical protein
MRIGKTYSHTQKEDENNYIKYTLILNQDTWVHITKFVKKGETIKEEISQGNFIEVDRHTTNFNTFSFYITNQKIKSKEKTEDKEIYGDLFATGSQYVGINPQDFSFSITENNKNVKLMNYKLE